MTREEAISLLYDMKDTYDEIHENTNYEIGYEQMTALDMAIEALSEPSLKAIKKQIDEHWYLDKSDLISRADALKKWDDLSERGRTEFDQVLMTLPSADRPQGDISEDGTLKVNVTDGAKVKRVLVLGGNNFGGLYYPE